MELLSATKIDLQLSDLRSWVKHPEPKIKRPAGIHLSGVLRVMAQEFQLLKDIEPADWEDEFPLRMVIGMAVERQTAGFYRDLQWQKWVGEKDGIIGSPDGFRRVEMINRVWEHKYTHKTARDFDLNHTKHTLWRWQLMGYCLMSGLTEAELHVVFGLGNYSRPYQEAYWKYVVRFSTEELEKFWKLVLRFKEKTLPEEGS